MNSSTTSTNRHGSAVITLPSETEIVITRIFDAPAELVFRAWTTPELVKRWWAGDRGVVTIADIDLRVGGSWRFVMTANAGFEVAFHGEYQEVDRPHRLVWTDVFEGFPDAAALTTMTLEDVGGITTMTTLVAHECQEHRDMHINSGMEGGLQTAYDCLEDLIRRPAA